MSLIDRNAHAQELSIILQELNTDSKDGLTEKEADNRLKQYGANELIQVKKISPWKILLKQFQDFLIYLLFFAVIVSVVVGFYEYYVNLNKTGKATFSSEWLDAIVIGVILVVNGILGFYQEYKAEKALESLKKIAPHYAKVKREGKVREIDVKYVVPGDILELDEGDKIPADSRLRKAFSLYVDEAILTGESKPVHKVLGIVQENKILAERTNMVYSNTIITRGNGEAIVIATGMNTEVGKIAEKLQEEEPQTSPFHQEMERFGKLLGKIIMIICFLVFAVELIIILLFEGIGFNDPHEIEEIVNALTVAISLAVSAVPEGLVVVITVVMSIGMRKMADKNALVKTLTAVETLGRVNVICSDKTGTLTKNEMTVVRIYVDGYEYKVDGVGYNLIGKILDHEDNVVVMNPDLRRFLEVCMFCNNSNVNERPGNTGDTDVVGDPTEISLKVLAMKMNLQTKTEKIDEIPFNSDRKMMSVIVKIDGELYALIKGAPDTLLNKASTGLLNGQEIPIKQLEKTIIEKNDFFAREALRVLGIGYKPLKEGYKEEDVEKDFIYLGLVGIIDPARDEVKDSILEAKMAGIRTVMITGDHKITAIAIAKQIGLASNDDAITGEELDSMSDEVLAQKIKSTNVFARVTSEHKYRILKALKAEDDIVSMTGDGVNDAPAVKSANVGVAMGLKGTEVTQEAADMILIDDNYATIVNAIEEGRGIYDTTKCFIRYMLSCNFDEIVMILVAWIVMKFFATIYLAQPLEAIQILWLNLATDSLPAMVLGLTPTDPDVMKYKPRKGFNMISDIKYLILYAAVLASILDVTLYLVTWSVLIPSWSDPSSFLYDARFVNGADIFGVHYTALQYQIAIAQSIVFTSVVFFELLFVFACTSEHRSFIEFRNKHLFWAVGVSFTLQLLVLYTPLCIAFHSVPLDRWNYWAAVFLGSSLWALPADEIRKFFRRRKQARDPVWQLRLTDHHRKAI
jgi:Ca2+-transporting ATPase